MPALVFVEILGICYGGEWLRRGFHAFCVNFTRGHWVFLMRERHVRALEFGRFRRLFPGFALVARGSSRSDVLKVAVWLQPTGGAPRISIASRSDACCTQRVHATQPRQLHYGQYLHQSPLPRCLQHQRPRALAAAGHEGGLTRQAGGCKRRWRDATATGR